MGLKEFLNMKELDRSEQQKPVDASFGGVVRKRVIRKRSAQEELLGLRTASENIFDFSQFLTRHYAMFCRIIELS